MIDYIKEIYDESEHDGFIFILDENMELDISAFNYKKRSKPVEIHDDLGYKYHIITYRETVDGEIVEPDMFEAIIGNPYHYCSTLLKAGFFGTICKKTKQSSRIVNGMYKDLVKTVKESSGDKKNS